jgi:hypothetical protein
MGGSDVRVVQSQDAGSCRPRQLIDGRTNATCLGSRDDRPFTPERCNSHLDELVGELQELSRLATLDMTIQVGKLVFERVFGASLALVRQQGRKSESFRRLARHPHLPFSATALWRSVATYELLQRLPGLSQAAHLGTAHLRVVLGLPQDEQEKLLRSAVTLRWTVQELELNARPRRQLRAPRRGRRALPVLVKALRTMQRITTDMDASKLSDLVNSESADDVLRRVLLLRAWCDDIAAAADSLITIHKPNS